MFLQKRGGFSFEFFGLHCFTVVTESILRQFELLDIYVTAFVGSSSYGIKCQVCGLDCAVLLLWPPLQSVNQFSYWNFI